MSRQDEDRREETAATELEANARRALELKRAAEEKSKRPESRTADEGMRAVPNEGIAPSGALNAEGHKLVIERSRKTR